MVETAVRWKQPFAVGKVNSGSVLSTARHFLASLAAAELLAGFIANLYFSLIFSRKDSVPLKTESAIWLLTTASVTLSLRMLHRISTSQ